MSGGSYLRWPWVRRSQFTAVTKRVDTLRAKYDAVWRDHLARCNCHDSWDQCPCVEVGHKTPLAEGHTIYDCANAATKGADVSTIDRTTTPDLIDLVRELRETLGLPAGALPITPKAAWGEAIAEVTRMRTYLTQGMCWRCEERSRWT